MTRAYDLAVWAVGEEHLQGTIPRVFLEADQASRPRDLQIRAGREQEASLVRKSFMLLILEKAAGPWSQQSGRS